MGCGKTLIAIAIATVLRLRMIIVCPINLVDKWRETLIEYNMKYITVLSYNDLKGNNKGECKKHNFLIRNNENYLASPYFTKVVQGLDIDPDTGLESGLGVLVIFDEYQACKNNSSLQHNSAAAIVKEMVKCVKLENRNNNIKSRIGLLSHTPLDKENCFDYIYKMAGIMTMDRLYRYNNTTKITTLTGYEQVELYCNMLDSRAVAEIKGGSIVDKKNINEIVRAFYMRIVKERISSTMPKLVIKNSVKYIMNGFYQMHPDDLELLRSANVSLKKAVRYNPRTGDFNLSNKGGIGFAERRIERSKLRILLRKTREILICDPHAKVILFINNKYSFKYLAENSMEYNPIVINGDTKKPLRTIMLNEFQEDNDSRRLLIISKRIGNSGIDLDDQYGGINDGHKRERYMFIVPDHKVIDLHQASGRTHRLTTKSNTYIWYVYCSEPSIETTIINAISKKTKLSKDMLAGNLDIKFPCDLEDDIEENVDFTIIPDLPKPFDPKDPDEYLTLQGSGNPVGTIDFNNIVLPQLPL